MLRYLVVRTVGRVQPQGLGVEFLLPNKLQRFGEMLVPCSRSTAGKKKHFSLQTVVVSHLSDGLTSQPWTPETDASNPTGVTSEAVSH